MEKPTDPAAEAILARARTHYQFTQYDACVELLAPRCGDPSTPLGWQRYLGLSLARRGDIDRALVALEVAAAQAPDDESLRAGLAVVQIQAKKEPVLLSSTSGGAGEAAAAVLWVSGQRRLRETRPLEAARLFLAAGERFRDVSTGWWLQERLSACYVGQVVSYLLADQPEAAQQSHGRAPYRGALPAAAQQFGQRLFEIGEAVRALDPSERAAALEPLSRLVLETRLQVSYFPDHALSAARITWSGNGAAPRSWWDWL